MRQLDIVRAGPLILLVATVLAAAVAPSALATDRFYPDSSATSLNGRYRIDAQSPDNAGGRPRPFAQNFTYTLTDTAANKVVWTRKQPMARAKGTSYVYSTEGSPIAVFVDDDGLVAARLARDTLLFLDPVNGRKRGEAEVLGAFPKAEQDEFVSYTTAGPSWSQDSDWFFLSLPTAGDRPARAYFVVRPYWNRRLVVDAATGKHVDLGNYRDARSAVDLTDADERIRLLLTAIIEDETRRALGAVSGALKKIENDLDYWTYRDIHTALHTICFLRLTQAEPLLRDLEANLDDLKQWHARTRGKVREAIRSLGRVPAAGYGVRVYPLIDRGNYMSADLENPYTAKVPVEDRVDNAAKVMVGMSVKELTDLLGCPDAEVYDGGRCYDYDIDGPAPYTLRVLVDQGYAGILLVKTITPFAFLHDVARMRTF